MSIEIRKDSKIVDVMVAQAKKERLDSNVAGEAANLIRDLATELTPHNRYQIAQLVGFAVNEITRPQTNWMDMIADTKRVGFGEKASFKVRQEGIRAFIQAKGATTSRSKVATKLVTLDTMSVSARPVINRVELLTGQVQMSDLISDAAYQMELKYCDRMQTVLNNAADDWASPYYGTGSGLVKATLDPMVRFWMRISGGAAPVIFGDINEIAKLTELTGFTTATNTKQYADAIMIEHNMAGYIGTYLGAKVVCLVNPYIDGSDTTVFNTNKLHIIPGFTDASMRPLKVVFEGDVQSQEAENIDDQTYEIRLDQYFNAGIVYGDRPYISQYADSGS